MKKLAVLIIILLLLNPIYAWEWIKAGELKEGDKLMDKGGNEIEIKTIEKAYSQDGIEVYGLDKPYFAEGILASNSIEKDEADNVKAGNELTGMASGEEITEGMVEVNGR